MATRTNLPWTAVIVVAAGAFLPVYGEPVAGEPSVALLRVPDGGIQPQVILDDHRVVHLVYSKGDPGYGDVFYVRSDDGGAAFSKPLRVNSQEGSAIATGTVRGAHMALGRANRVHVAWMGSKVAQPQAPDGTAPMLYTRLNDAGDAFEPQRNVVTKQPGLDGGGSVAADTKGNVYVAWHAPQKTGGGEADRQVWVARSADDGRTFSPEVAASPAGSGSCACCGMRLQVSADGRLVGLFRSASEMVHRDIYLLTSTNNARTFEAARIGPMEFPGCIMSTSAITLSPRGTLLAWETRGQVYWSRLDPKANGISTPIAAPGTRPNRKHPAIAEDSTGRVLLAWTEGTSWGKGGSIGWQVFDPTGKPLPGEAGRAEGLPAWSLPAALSQPGGGFAILY